MIVYISMGGNRQINFNSSHTIKTSSDFFYFKVIYPKRCLKLFPEATIHRVPLQQLFKKNLGNFQEKSFWGTFLKISSRLLLIVPPFAGFSKLHYILVKLLSNFSSYTVLNQVCLCLIIDF